MAGEPDSTCAGDGELGGAGGSAAVIAKARNGDEESSCREGHAQGERPDAPVKTPSSQHELRKIQFPISKTSFGPDSKKQGCHEASMREGAAVIPPRGKLRTDATMVPMSPFESLVLEAVLTVIGGESAQAVSDPVQEIARLLHPPGRRGANHISTMAEPIHDWYAVITYRSN